VLVNTNQGMIRMCMDFHDMNKSCLKDNFPTLFIEQIVDECASCEVFSFMDFFFRVQPYLDEARGPT
jgi:hypothetical protein